MLLAPILIPACFGLLTIVINKGQIPAWLCLIGASANLILAVMLFRVDLTWATTWGWTFKFELRNYAFSSFILLAAGGFGFLIAIYSLAFMKGRRHLNQFFAYFLLTLALTNGATLADNLIVLLFFWEGLLVTLFGMIAVGNPGAFRTATKALIISGVADLSLMLGVGLTIYVAGTATISSIHLPVEGFGTLAYILMMLGAIAKAGSMPFHSWIPDAAADSPLPFMALIPASLEKLLGIYFLSRLSLDIFKLEPTSWVSTLVMVIGAVTILLAVLMALVQSDYKKLLSFHAISQVGYMVLGVGTAVPAGIVGGIFHMINHALYKSCLFLTGGAVEKQAGTTDLKVLGGLAKVMPLTCIGFLIAACSISGVPPFNGFFSKELVYEGALERGLWFYIAAVSGSFLTAASFLKLGHAAFFGPSSAKSENVREAPFAMLIPILTIAGICVLFGLWNALPIRELIQPAVGSNLEGRDFGGFHVSLMLAGVTIVVLVAALIHHLIGVNRTGSGLKALDNIHYAPVAKQLYDQAERGRFDPYNIGILFVGMFSKLAYYMDRWVDAIYTPITNRLVGACSQIVRACHTGSHALYVVWALVGAMIVVIYMLGGF